MASARNPITVLLAALLFAASLCEGRLMKNDKKLVIDALSKNEFRPTSPGVSPGAGHSFQGLINHAPKPQGPNRQENGNNVRYDLTGSSENDFRPTGPGRSPGAGHAAKMATSELKP